MTGVHGDGDLLTVHATGIDEAFPSGFCGPSAAAGAIHAERSLGHELEPAEGDVLTAFRAGPERAGLNTFQSAMDHFEPDLRTSPTFCAHGLRLDGLHAGQAADRVVR
jgi:hypothetical protein